MKCRILDKHLLKRCTSAVDVAEGVFNIWYRFIWFNQFDIQYKMLKWNFWQRCTSATDVAEGVFNIFYINFYDLINLIFDMKCKILE